MGYVEDHLLPDERIVHRAHLHKIAYVTPLLISLALIVAGALALAYSPDYSVFAIIVFLAALVPLVSAYVLASSSEFAVTDRRVIIKVGFIQRRTLETLLSKVEGIEVNQGFLARMLDYGTIVVTGTGGTRETFNNIAAPLEFRRQVQAQVTAPRPMYVTGTGAPRDERDCPFCAEPILKRAKVCKHCGRDVEPLVT